VILGSLKNFIGDYLSKLQRLPDEFQGFWQFRPATSSPRPGRSFCVAQFRCSL